MVIKKLVDFSCEMRLQLQIISPRGPNIIHFWFVIFGLVGTTIINFTSRCRRCVSYLRARDFSKLFIMSGISFWNLLAGSQVCSIYPFYLIIYSFYLPRFSWRTIFSITYSSRPWNIISAGGGISRSNESDFACSRWITEITGWTRDILDDNSNL